MLSNIFVRDRVRLAALLIFSAAATGAFCAEQPTLSVKADRADSLYKRGETATFTISAEGLPAGSGPISYSILRDGIHTIDSGTVNLAGAPATLKLSLDQPGHLICRANLAGTSPAAIGVLFDPLDIEPGIAEEPDGYEAFWDAQRKLLRDNPAVPDLKSVASPSEKAEVFDVTIAMPEGRPVRGYFALPKNATAGSHPAIAFFHGAGVRSAGKGSVAKAAADGMIAIEINAHGIDNDQPASFYTDFEKNELGGVYYPHIGRESRDTWYMLNMYRRLMRALDFLAERPEWDGRILVTSGSSQGGAQSIAAAGLDPRVTAFAAYVPGMVDLAGCEAGRIGGWPRPVPVGKDGRCTDPAILGEARYFDVVHFTRRTKAEGFFSVGLIDLTCPATSIYAAYNQIPEERRQILIRPDMSHANPSDISAKGYAFLLDHVRRMQNEAKTAATRKAG